MLSDEVKRLEQDSKGFREKAVSAIQERDYWKSRYEAAKEILDHGKPVQVFYHKGRRNTTVKFADGTCTTVKLKKGEKHCIETAIAYAIVKQTFETSYLKKLVREVKETDVEKEKEE